MFMAEMYLKMPTRHTVLVHSVKAPVWDEALILPFLMFGLKKVEKGYFQDAT